MNTEYVRMPSGNLRIRRFKGASVRKSDDTYIDRHSETGVPITRHYHDVTLVDGSVHRCHTRGAAELLAGLSNHNATDNTGRMRDFHYSEDYAQ